MVKIFSPAANNSTSHFSAELPGKNILYRHYQNLVAKNYIQHDISQILILRNLQHLLDHIIDEVSFQTRPWLSRLVFASEHRKIRSMYIYGGVGRGKSMLMDMFFQACPIQSKRRVHFHVFMQDVHQYMHEWRESNSGDPIPALAKHIKKTSLLLCFDEFHISDIADAMLLSRLFTRLSKQGVVFVATSNQHPNDLYPDGLQRELFLPFIEFLKKSSDVLELRAKEDYRLSYFKSLKTMFHLNLESEGNDFLLDRFNELTKEASPSQKILIISGREVSFEHVHDDVLYTSFDEICGRALGPSDYQAVATEFSTVLLSNIPRLTKEIKDLARRFVTLIDLLYEHNVKLICTSEIPVEKMYIEEFAFDFIRTRSRLIEMQSEQYVQRKHIK